MPAHVKKSISAYKFYISIKREKTHFRRHGKKHRPPDDEKKEKTVVLLCVLTFQIGLLKSGFFWNKKCEARGNGGINSAVL